MARKEEWAGISGLVNGRVKSSPPKLLQNLKNGTGIEKVKSTLDGQKARL